MKILSVLSFVFFFVLDTQASEWIKRADFGGVGRHRGCAISIGNKGYMGLGHYNGAGPNIVMADWWEYDPATNAWTQKANYNGNGAIGNYAVLAFGMDNVGFVGGGQVASNNSFHKYDPALNTWTPVAQMPLLFMNTQGFVINNKGYAINGSQVYEYNAATNIWSAKNIAPFFVGVWNSTFVLDNKGYVKSNNTLWEYKPAIDQWAMRASFPGLASGGSSSFTQNGKGYIVSGYAGWLSEVNSEVWEYNPGTNEWQQLPQFDGTARRFSSSFNIGNRCFMGIGTNGTNFSDFWEFDALANLKEMFDVTQFACYPNPATDVIRFRSENLVSFELRLFNRMGQLMEDFETNSNEIQISRNNLKSGLYLYQIVVDNMVVHNGKFIFN